MKTSLLLLPGLFLAACPSLIPGMAAEAAATVPATVPAASTEVPPDLASKIDRYLALRTGLTIRSLGQRLGNAFMQESFLAAFRQNLLAGKECPAPEQTPCPLACQMANEILVRFDLGDYNPQHILREITAELAKTDFSEENALEEMSELYRTVEEAYHPILEAREESKERDLLRMNAMRPEVKTLPGGIQYETEPGGDSIRSINRCTRETGIAFYVRTTSETSFDRLPESVRQIANELPAASSWTFYVPAEAEQAVRNARRQQAKDLDARRLAQLKKLLPGRLDHILPSDEPPTEETAERIRLLRLRVWKDDPRSPVRVKPDVYGRDL